MGKELYEDFLFPSKHPQYKEIKDNWEFVDSFDYRDDLLYFKEHKEDYLQRVDIFIDYLEDKYANEDMPECCGKKPNQCMFNWFNANEFSTYLLRRYPDLIYDIKETDDGALDMYCNYYYWFVWK